MEGSKVHVAVSRESLPLSMVVGPGDEHDSKRFMEVLDGIWVGHGAGRPRSRPGEVHGDPAYDTREMRSYLEGRGIKANIAVNPRSRLKPRCGRPYRLDEEAYKRMRSCVERFSEWLKGRIQKASPKMGEAGINLPKPHTTGMHHDILESFEMSSRIIGDFLLPKPFVDMNRGVEALQEVDVTCRCQGGSTLRRAWTRG